LRSAQPPQVVLCALGFDDLELHAAARDDLGVAIGDIVVTAFLRPGEQYHRVRRRRANEFDRQPGGERGDQQHGHADHQQVVPGYGHQFGRQWQAFVFLGVHKSPELSTVQLAV